MDSVRIPRSHLPPMDFTRSLIIMGFNTNRALQIGTSENFKALLDSVRRYEYKKLFFIYLLLFLNRQ